MHDKACERSDCEGCDCRPPVPDFDPCICSMQDLMTRGCTCGALAAERAMIDERRSE